MAYSLAQGMGLVQMIIIIGILLGVGAIALQSFSDSLSAGEAKNAVNNATEGVSKFAQQMPNIGLIGAVSVLLGIVVGGFMLTRGR